MHLAILCDEIIWRSVEKILQESCLYNRWASHKFISNFEDCMFIGHIPDWLENVASDPDV